MLMFAAASKVAEAVVHSVVQPAKKPVDQVEQ